MNHRGNVEVLLFRGAVSDESGLEDSKTGAHQQAPASRALQALPRLCDMHSCHDLILTSDSRDSVLILDYSCSKRVVLEVSLTDINLTLNSSTRGSYNNESTRPRVAHMDTSAMERDIEDYSNQMVHNTVGLPLAAEHSPSLGIASSSSGSAPGSAPNGTINLLQFADYATMNATFNCKSSHADLDISNHISNSRILLLCTSAVILYDYCTPSDSILITSASLNGALPSSAAFIDPHALAVGCSDGTVHVFRIGRGICRPLGQQPASKSEFIRLKSIGMHSKHEILYLKALPSHYSYRDRLLMDPFEGSVQSLYSFTDSSNSHSDSVVSMTRQPARCLSIDSGGGIYIWDFHLAYRREAGRLYIVDLVGCKAPLARLAYDTSIFSALKQKSIVFEGVYIDSALQTITISTSDRHIRLWDVSQLDIFGASATPAATSSRGRSETTDSKFSGSGTSGGAVARSNSAAEKGRNTRQQVDLSSTLDVHAFSQLKMAGSLKSKYSTTSANALVAPVPFFHSSFSINGSIMGTYLVTSKNSRTIAVAQSSGSSLTGDDDSDTASLHSSITATNGPHGSSHTAISRLKLVDEIDIADALTRVGIAKSDLPSLSAADSTSSGKRHLKYYFTSTSPSRPNILAIGSSRGLLVLALHPSVVGPPVATHPLWLRQHLLFQSGSLRQVLVGGGEGVGEGAWAPVTHEIISEFDLGKQQTTSSSSSSSSNSIDTSSELMHRLCCLSQQCRPAVHCSPSGKFCAFVFPATFVYIIVSVNAVDDKVTSASTLREVCRGRCEAFGWLAIAPWHDCYCIVPLLPKRSLTADDDNSIITTAATPTMTTTMTASGVIGTHKTPQKNGKRISVLKKTMSLFGRTAGTEDTDVHWASGPPQFSYILTSGDANSSSGCVYKVEAISADTLDTTAVNSSRLQQMLGGVLLGATMTAPEDASNRAAQATTDDLLSTGSYRKRGITKLLYIASPPLSPVRHVPKAGNMGARHGASAAAPPHVAESYANSKNVYSVLEMGPPMATVSAISWNYISGCAAVLIGCRINILRLVLMDGGGASSINGTYSLQALSSVYCDVSPFTGYNCFYWKQQPSEPSGELIYHSRSAVMTLTVDGSSVDATATHLCTLSARSLIVPVSRGSRASDLSIHTRRSATQNTVPFASGVYGSADVVEIVGADEEFVYVNAKKAANIYDNNVIAIRASNRQAT